MMTTGIAVTGNRRADDATSEIALALRDASPGKSDQYYYDEAMRLRDEILAGAAELAARPPVRRARVAKGRKAFPKNEVMAYLPSNYQVTGEDDEYVYFEGRDNAGWTLDGYVIPRLASGLIFAEEVQP
jgi:hypothetical protein